MAVDDPAGTPAGDVTLRRSLRDLIALTMLPTVWAGYDAGQICADLVDVVARMIDPDGVYLTSPSNGCSEVLRLRKEGDRDVERLLRASTAESAAGIARIELPLSASAGDRFVVAARRADFPSEIERLIVRVAVNQASTWLEWKRAEPGSVQA